MPCPLMFGHLCHPGISRLSIEYVGMTFHWLRKIIIKRTHPFNLATPQDVIGTIKSISLLEGRQVHVTSICMHKATALNHSQSFKFSIMPLIDHRTIFIILWWLKEYHYTFLEISCKRWGASGLSNYSVNSLRPNDAYMRQWSNQHWVR